MVGADKSAQGVGDFTLMSNGLFKLLKQHSMP